MQKVSLARLSIRWFNVIRFVFGAGNLIFPVHMGQEAGLPSFSKLGLLSHWNWLTFSWCHCYGCF